MCSHRLFLGPMGLAKPVAARKRTRNAQVVTELSPLPLPQHQGSGYQTFGHLLPLWTQEKRIRTGIPSRSSRRSTGSFP